MDRTVVMYAHGELPGYLFPSAMSDAILICPWCQDLE